MDHYRETPEQAASYRERFAQSLTQAVKTLQEMAPAKRAASMPLDLSSVDAYVQDINRHRQRFAAMLGWPLNEPRQASPVMRTEFVAEDGQSRIFRCLTQIDLLGIVSYGLLLLPRGFDPPYPLILTQHGGWGTPELAAGFLGESAYHDMSARMLQAGYAVYLPQLLLWKEERFGPRPDRAHLDRQLKQLGGSITALEVFMLQRVLDCLARRPDIDASRIGMQGVSYGGFYALVLPAVDTRICATASSAYLADRFTYDFADWTWHNSGNLFDDGEICALICPRPLYIEVGREDAVFDWRLAVPQAERIQGIYDGLGLSERFVFRVHDDGHVCHPDGAGTSFLRQHV